MKQLNEIKPGVKVTVKRIDGGQEVEKRLKDLGISEGVELTVIATEPVHVHSGPIAVRAAGREIVIARGWADKVYVDTEGTTLLSLEEGDKGTIKAIEGGKAFEDRLSELGVKRGTEIEFLHHLADDSLVLKIEEREIRIGAGLASKVLVEKEGEGRTVQLCYLDEGEHAKIRRIIGGRSLKAKFEEPGLTEGVDITLIRREKSITGSERGSYVVAKLNQQHVTIGHGLAEKIWVE